MRPGARVDAGRERLEVRAEQLGELAPLLDERARWGARRGGRAARARRWSSPVLPLLPGARPRRLKSTSASCCGEPMVNSPPAALQTSSRTSSTRSRTRAVISPRRYGSTLTPAASMRREHVHERQLDLAEQPLEAELEQARALLLRNLPGEQRARGGHGLGLRRLDQHGAVLGAGQREQAALLLGHLGRQQVGGHGGVERRAARRRPIPRLRLGIVHHGVRRQQPERRQALGRGGGQLHEVAAAVHGHDPAVPVAGRLHGDGRLVLLQGGGQRADVGLVRRGARRPAVGACRLRRAPRPAVGRRSSPAGAASGS